MVELYKEKKDCCYCTACINVCTTKAITTIIDMDGFAFPEINRDLCMECGLCNKVCAFQNRPLSGQEPIKTYAAVNKNKDILYESSSGGAFGALAHIVLQKGGIVFGCGYSENMEPSHIAVGDINGLKKIQGSKYVQSNIGTSFRETKTYLKSNKPVLFTGTPCQIAGLKSYLGKDYANLITVDIICHGVPSFEFFKGYIQYLEQKLNGKIIDFLFRDKSQGWGLKGRIVYEQKGLVKEKRISAARSYYYQYFLNGDIFRESCYHCKYACCFREGDFTIGDFWGVHKYHPEVDINKGVSLLLINTKKGQGIKHKLTEHLDLVESRLNYALEENFQLVRPSSLSAKRKPILALWREKGSSAVALEYKKSHLSRIMASYFRGFVPKYIKNGIRRFVENSKR